ncbi:SprB repeat-containing protein, partial [Tenacibaculum amylolyticum]|uniref:SprB repeat-containing protein n=1 Tax=Tenacibaculum amylolyticum TaxID=104269 RepID=UPI0038B4F6BA
SVAGITYTITATGTNGCTSMQTATIFELAPVAFDPASPPVVTPFGCTTDNITNSAVVTVNPGDITGGSGTYVRVVFVYDNGTVAVGDDITQDGTSFSFTVSNVLGGNVSITVYDDEGCSANTTAVIPAFNALSNPVIVVDKDIDCRVLPAGGEEITVSADLTNALGLGEDLIFTITGAGGFTATNTVNGPSAGTTVSSSFTGLAEDIYSITIENSVTGCVLTASHQVDAVPTFDLDISRDSNVVCFGDNNGSITFDFATSSPYAGAYSYEVFNTNGTPGTGDDFSVSGPTVVAAAAGARPITVNTLVGGTYYVSVTMTDASGPFCSVISPEVTIDAPAAALSFSTVDVNPTCNGFNDGSITVNAVDGWGGYEYQLEDGSGILVPYSTNNVFTGSASLPLVDGSYTVRVRDANGCIVNGTVTLTEPDPVTFSLDKDDNACDLTGGGSITAINVLGGSGVYTYVLLDASNTEIRNQTSNVFTNLPAGSYTVQVSDSNSCSSTDASITLEPNLEFSLSTTKLLDCTVSPDATITLTISSGSGNYEYEVFDSAAGTVVARVAVVGTTASFNVSTADTYTVNVYDTGALPAPGCSRTRTITVDPIITPDFTAVAIDNSNCDGSNGGV